MQEKTQKKKPEFKCIIGVVEEQQVFEDMATFVIQEKLGEGYFLEEWDNGNIRPLD